MIGQDVYNDMRMRNKQIYRIIGSVPTLAAFAYRHRMGMFYFCLFCIFIFLIFVVPKNEKQKRKTKNTL